MLGLAHPALRQMPDCSVCSLPLKWVGASNSRELKVVVPLVEVLGRLRLSGTISNAQPYSSEHLARFKSGCNDSFRQGFRIKQEFGWAMLVTVFFRLIALNRLNEVGRERIDLESLIKPDLA